MRNLLYAIGLILIITWAIEYIGNGIGGMVHILVAVAIVAIVSGVFQGIKHRSHHSGIVIKPVINN